MTEHLAAAAEALEKMDNDSKADALIKMQLAVNEIITNEEILMDMSDEDREAAMAEWAGDDALRKAAWGQVMARFARAKASGAARSMGAAASGAADAVSQKASLGYRLARRKVNAGIGAAKDFATSLPGRAKAAYGAGADAAESAGSSLGIKGARIRNNMNRYGKGKGHSESRLVNYSRAGGKVGRAAFHGAAGLAAGGAAAGLGYAGYQKAKQYSKADEGADLEKGVARQLMRGVIHAKHAGQAAGDATKQAARFLSVNSRRGANNVMRGARDGLQSGYQHAADQFRAMPGRISAAYQAVQDGAEDIGGTIGIKAAQVRNNLNRYGKGKGNSESNRLVNYSRLVEWNRYGKAIGAKVPLGMATAAGAGGAAYGIHRALSDRQVEQRRAAGRASAAKRRQG